MRYVISVVLISMLTGCFSRWVMTEKEIKAYYAQKPVKPTFFTIQNDSVKLFCATTGSDTLPPLLLVHGAPGAWYGSRIMLDDTLLQAHFHIIAMDRPGYNKSRFRNRKKAVTSIDLQATAIMEALRLNKSREKGIVLGSSYGAPIALEIAVRHPEKFYHLFLLAAAIDPDKEKFWWFHKYIRGGPVHWFMPRFLRTATDEKFAHVGELRKLQLAWQRVSVPVTVIQGGSDHIIDPTNLDYAKKQLQGKPAEFIFIPEAGHLLRFRYSNLVKEVILKAEGELTVDR
ncbi:MAG TPA: alpha/beta fold hydrolase [Chitinophagaceae bacterium]|jgi:pimeloyl-ACP methyl ester carboxylesterase|nr:alpha/beta fold hydrolase [Chitinophagaceae bacterium]